MTSITQISKVIANSGKEEEEQEVFFDPASIILIAKITISLIQAVQKCKRGPESTVSLIRDVKRHRFVRGRIKRAVRRKIGIKKFFSKEVNDLTDKIWKTSAGLSTEEFRELYDEVA